MSEHLFHKRPRPKSTIEKVFIGVGNASKEIAHKQEQGILWIINKHIVPHLSEKNQKLAQKNKARIELYAKRAGIGLTAAEIIAGVILSAKGLKKLLTSKNKHPEHFTNTVPTPPTEFKLDPYATQLEDAAKIITRPATIAKQKARDAKTFAEAVPTITNFKVETLPTHTQLLPEVSTKVFYNSGGATDFAGTPNHYLFSGNEQFDHGFTVEAIQRLAVFERRDFPPPLIHMNYTGTLGKAIRLHEGSFGVGRTNRPFWHSNQLRQSSYDDLIRALERGLPAISHGLDAPMTVLANTQAHADAIADLFNVQSAYPWKTIGKGLEYVPNIRSLERAAEQFLTSQPPVEASLHFGRHLWDPNMEPLKDASLPIMASLLDAALTQQAARQSCSLFVPSPSFDVLQPGHEPIGDALVMQTWYALFIPLIREYRNMTPIQPFIHKLPGFSTSPALGQSIRFFLPHEQNAAAKYEWRHIFVNPTPQSKRAQQFLEALQSVMHWDRLKTINDWRRLIFEKQLAII